TGSTSSQLAIRVDAEQPGPAVPVAGDVAVGTFRETREGAEDCGQRTSPGEDSSQRLGNGPGREQLAVGVDQMPGVEAHLRIHAREQALALLALDRDGAEALRAIPGQDLLQRPLTETAVLVIEEDVLARRHPSASRRAGTPA